jgi:hypothetical protein
MILPTPVCAQTAGKAKTPARSAAAAPPAVLHYEVVRSLTVREQDGISVKTIGSLNVPEAGVVILTLESITDVARAALLITSTRALVW